MADQSVQWEYRVQTVGNAFTGARDEMIEATLNDWGLEGWEAVNIYAPSHICLSATQNKCSIDKL